MKLAVIGNISIDTINYHDQRKVSFWGGAGLNIAIAVKKAKASVALISLVGEKSELIIEYINQLGINDLVLKDLSKKNCEFEIFYDDTDKLNKITYEFGVMNSINTYLEYFDYSSYDFYHVCCKNPLKSVFCIEKIIKSRKKFSLGFIKSSILKQISEIGENIYFADFIFINNEELDILKEYCDLRKINLLIVTNGSNPVRVFKNGFLQNEYICKPKKNVIDVTGAGDTIIGSFLGQYFNEKNIEKAIIYAIEKAYEKLDTFGVANILIP